MDLKKAIKFVEDNGNQFERARLNHTLGRDFDADEVLRGFSAIQNPDGGFPYCDRKGFPSCLSNTAMALHTLLEMGLHESEPAKNGIEFLRAMRKDDGIWEENPKIAPLEPPPWDLPGDPEASIWLTADAADVLLRYGDRVSPNTVDFLRSKQDPDGRLEGYCHATWIALSVFGKNGHRDEEVYSKAMGYLESLDKSDWEPSCIAWCLDCMKNGNEGKGSILSTQLKEILSNCQETDGSWASDSDGITRTRDTNSVLAALSGMMDE